jgi:hypothetical protein
MATGETGFDAVTPDLISLRSASVEEPGQGVG